MFMVKSHLRWEYLVILERVSVRWANLAKQSLRQCLGQLLAYWKDVARTPTGVIENWGDDSPVDSSLDAWLRDILAARDARQFQQILDRLDAKRAPPLQLMLPQPPLALSEHI